MAKTKSSEDATLPTKRKAQDHDNSPLKAPKIVPQDEIEDTEENQTSKNNNLGTPVPESKTGDQEPEVDAEEDEDADYEEDEDDDEGDAQVDRKGKGILIEEEDDDDEDDDDDSGDGEDGESDAESDLSDDPLAEVDLDNILPSRTRRRVVQPGVHISNDHGKKSGDDDSSDRRRM